MVVQNLLNCEHTEHEIICLSICGEKSTLNDFLGDKHFKDLIMCALLIEGNKFPNPRELTSDDFMVSLETPSTRDVYILALHDHDQN